MILLAVLLGALFGFALHRAGASNPQNIINMLRLTDLHLMKAILFGIALSSSLLFLSLSIGAVEASHIAVKSSYWGVIIGGAILGIGFAIGGYCPGTGLAALGDGRKDAAFFVLGGLVGALIYMIVYPSIDGTILLQKIAGGKVTLAYIENSGYGSLIQAIPGIAVALGIAALFFLFTWVLPNNCD